MIKATSQSVCSGMTGCQVEILGSGAELLREYRGVTAAIYRSEAGQQTVQEIVALKKKNRRKMTDYEIGEMFA